MIWRSFRLVLFGLLVFNLYFWVSHRLGHHPQPGFAAAQDVETENSPIYFSPDTNLEEVDVAMIDRAQRTIDIAMYAFTDRRIAAALRRAAERGVKVRIYRDREQYEEEERRGGSVRAILAGAPNIAVKVKTSKELMHQKVALYDDRLLRDGSGNWSISAARYQDNEISVSGNAAMIHAFRSDFDRMWSRTDNTVIQ
jgi:phosphatidylserine/phosphatidylglycerophosphate/cardiolipin synthase-like enzyme